MTSLRQIVLGICGLIATTSVCAGESEPPVSPELRAEVALMRQATAKFMDFDVAVAHRYDVRTACERVWSHPEGPGKVRYLPANYVNNEFVDSHALEITKPQQLRYGYAENGKRQLVGIGYIIKDRAPGFSQAESLAKRKAFLPQVDLKHWKFVAAECHYMDGYVVPHVPLIKECPGRFYDQGRTRPIPISIHHGDAWRLFFWIWRENPDGMLHHSTPVDICGKSATEWKLQ